MAQFQNPDNDPNRLDKPVEENSDELSEAEEQRDRLLDPTDREELDVGRPDNRSPRM